MAEIYAKSDASGANNGTSWDDAYTSLASAVSALSNNDTLYTDAPLETPFTGGHFILRSGVTIVTGEGPSGVTYLDNRYFETGWTDEGGGIWSIARAAEPDRVIFDGRQDEPKGGLTGIDFSDTATVATISGTTYTITYAQALRWAGVNPDYCIPWVGYLTRTTGTESAPAAGQWGYTGGRLYIHPTGSFSQSQIDALAGYTKTPTEQLLQGFKFTGNNVRITRGSGVGLIGLFHHADSNDASLISVDANGVVVEDVYAIMGGKHAVTFAFGTGLTGTMRRCVCVGACGDAQPFVHFRSGGSAGPNDRIGTDLSFIAHPPLGEDGSPIPEADWNPIGSWGPRAVYSHTDGGGNTMDVQWRRVVQFDMRDKIAAKHSMSVGGNNGSLVSAGQPTIPADADVRDFDSYANSIQDFIATGRSAQLSVAGGKTMGMKRGILDRTGAPAATSVTGQVLLDSLNNSVSNKICHEDVLIKTGETSRSYYDDFWDNASGRAGSWLSFKDCAIELQSTTAGAAFINVALASTSPQDALFLSGNQVNTDGTATDFLSGGGTFSGNPSVGLESDGTNVFSSDFVWAVEGPTDRNPAYWIANIAADDWSQQTATKALPGLTSFYGEVLGVSSGGRIPLTPFDSRLGGGSGIYPGAARRRKRMRRQGGAR